MGPHVFVQTGIVRVERHAGGRSEEIFSVRLDDALGLDKFAERCSDVFDIETDEGRRAMGKGAEAELTADWDLEALKAQARGPYRRRSGA